MQKVEPVEPVCEAVHVMKKLRHVTVNDDGTAVFETHLENVDPGQEIKLVPLLITFNSIWCHPHKGGTIMGKFWNLLIHLINVTRSVALATCIS